MKQLGHPISLSIGVNQESKELLKLLFSEEIIPDFLTIDIAHGHSVKMELMLQWIKEFYYYQKMPFLIAGNVSTAEAVIDLEMWGANAIKVGIGPGSACTTYNATGFGSRGCQASSIQTCAAAKRISSTLIIADGGIQHPGDIAKSLALGADMVMVGGMFSGLEDSPGSVVSVVSSGQDVKLYKEFWGSASAFQSGKTKHVEGTKKLVPMKPHGILHEMDILQQCLQSAISYGGGKDLSCFKTVSYV